MAQKDSSGQKNHNEGEGDNIFSGNYTASEWQNNALNEGMEDDHDHDW